MLPCTAQLRGDAEVHPASPLSRTNMSALSVSHGVVGNLDALCGCALVKIWRRAC